MAMVRIGNLMVYWGAPNIQDYAPGPHSFINAHDFKGPKELAEYIIEVIHYFLSHPPRPPSTYALMTFV
jgi:hypothetical protein